MFPPCSGSRPSFNVVLGAISVKELGNLDIRWLIWTGTGVMGGRCGEGAKPPTAKPKVASTPAAPARRTIIRRKAESPSDSSGEARQTPPTDDLPRDTLIVASKLKQYVKARSGINCSDRVLGPLSDAVRRLCDEAIEKAIADERKTLLDRDFD